MTENSNIKDHVLAIIAAETENGVDTSTGAIFPGGEINTASNLSEFGLYKEKVGVDLRFRGIDTETPSQIEIKFSVDEETLLVNFVGAGVAGLQAEYETGRIIQTTTVTGPLDFVADEELVRLTAANQEVQVLGGNSRVYLGGGNAGVWIGGESGPINLSGGSGGIAISGGSGIQINTNGGFAFVGESPETWSHSAPVTETFSAPVVENVNSLFNRVSTAPWTWDINGTAEVNVNSPLKFDVVSSPVEFSLVGPPVMFSAAGGPLFISYNGPTGFPVVNSEVLNLRGEKVLDARNSDSTGYIYIQSGTGIRPEPGGASLELNAGGIIYSSIASGGGPVGGLLRLGKDQSGQYWPTNSLISSVYQSPGYSVEAENYIISDNRVQGGASVTLQAKQRGGAGTAGNTSVAVYSENFAATPGYSSITISALNDSSNDVNNTFLMLASKGHSYFMNNSLPGAKAIFYTSSGVQFNASTFAAPVELTDGTSSGLSTTKKSIIEAINEVRGLASGVTLQGAYNNGPGIVTSSNPLQFLTSGPPVTIGANNGSGGLGSDYWQFLYSGPNVMNVLGYMDNLSLYADANILLRSPSGGASATFEAVDGSTLVGGTGSLSSTAIRSGGPLTLKDVNLSSPIPVSQSGVAGLSGFTAISIVGALNELRAGAAGEANTSSNLGTGEGLAAPKSGVNLPFKSLKAGTNVSLSSDANEITISASGGGTAVRQMCYQASCLAQVSSTIGMLVKAPTGTANPGGIAITRGTDAFVNGSHDPFMVCFDQKLKAVHVICAVAATGLGTVGANPTCRIDIYKTNMASRTLLATVRAPVVSGLGYIQVWNNLGGTPAGFTTFHFDFTSTITLNHGDMFGFEFVNENSDDNKINAISRPFVTVETEEV